MKKLLYLMMLLFVHNNVKADVVLPNGTFKNFLKIRYPSCFYIDANQVEWLNTSCSEITSEDSLDMSDTSLGDLDMEGIQYFTSLKYLNCTLAGLVSSPPLPASLVKLVFVSAINNQPYGSFPASFLPNGLRYLDMSSNYMYAPPSWPDSLRYLNCSDNSIGSSFSPMPALPLFLDTFICRSQEIYSGNNNILTALPALPATLKYLDCSRNSLYTLPASLPASLIYLDCSQQYTRPTLQTFSFFITELPPLPQSLQTLICNNLKLTALPSLPPSLKYIDCSFNRKFYNNLGLNLTNPGPNVIEYEGIDVLPDLPASLKYLNCSYNRLTNLPTIPPTVTYLNCRDNIYAGETNIQSGGIDFLEPLPLQLDTLDVGGTPMHCLPRLPASLKLLVVDESGITCVPNSGTYITVIAFNITGTLPLCTIFNNSYGCPSNGTITGNIYYDNNSNGIRDAGENYRSNVEVQLSNGQHAYTNYSGYYELTADPGSYTLSVIQPTLYTAVPANINYVITNYDTLIHEMIALQPTVSRDSIIVTVVPLNPPRPGQNLLYAVSYTNVGTTVISPSIQMSYDNSRLTYIGSTNPTVVNNGNHLSLTESNLAPGVQHNFTATFKVKLTVILGDTLYANTIAEAGTCIATDSVSQIIVNSFDPNDKSATFSLTTNQVAAGTYINYLVRFQNTGTASAIRVIVTDTLSSFLDPSTFRLINTSHTCRANRIGNNISFTFSNIMLPDSTSDEAGSHGFIRFAVKSFISVPVNTVIPNDASIYFDFNQPVVTNIATTTIVLPDEVTPTPVTTLSFTAMADASNNALLNWNTEDEYNTSSFDIEQSIDGTSFSTIGTKAAIGPGDHAYSYSTIIPADIVYYRIKMIYLDGSYTYSEKIQVNKNKRLEPIVVLSNPAKETLSLIVSDVTLVNTTATIINELGAVVKRFVLKNGIQSIDVSNFSTGIYYLKTTLKAARIMISH
ncbi:MAG: SdrD B-like domain-containing protein [Ferruginibacter sp.]